ncbi:MAG: M20 family metallopeptidase [Desulfurococcaceae archaeon]
MDIKNVVEIAIKVLLDSIRYKTVLGEEYETAVDYYRELLSNYGIHVTVHRVPDEYLASVLPKQFHPERPRYILLARIGHGYKVLQFNGHYDVVPPGEGWETDPFTPVISNGRLYGRGSSDMKGGIAAVLATLIYFAQKTREPEIVVEAVLVPDEEIGGVSGTGYLVNQLGSRPDWVIIAEPSGIDTIYLGHRGNVWAVVKTFGKQAHGSVPWLGDNAFEKMITLAKEFLNRYKLLLDRRVSKHSYEHPEASKPSITAGGLLISPGAVNIVPGVSGFSIDRRLIIEEKADDVVVEIKELIDSISREIGIKAEVEIVDKSDPAYTSEDSYIVRALETVIAEKIGTMPRKLICSGGLDLKYYSNKAIPAIAYGPGSTDMAHKPNEYIELSDIERAINVYVELIKKLESQAVS